MAILYAPYLRATNQANAPIPGAFATFYVSGTSTLQPIYANSTLSIPLANPQQADGNGVFSQIWLDDSLPPYKVILQYPDVNNPSIPGALVAGPRGTIDPYNPVTTTAATLFPLINRATDAEIAVGITPTNFAIAEEGNLRRYGGLGDGLADDSDAYRQAVLLGKVRIPKGFTFKIVPGATRSGPISMSGEGPTSILLNDSAQGTTPLLTLTNGDGSSLRDFYVGTITAPLTIQRYVTNTASTTAATTISVNTIVVASATGISIGMQCFGDNTKVWNGAIVQNVAGTTITLSKSSLATAANVPVRFQSITFNTAAPYPVYGTDPYTTRGQSSAAGRVSPSVNDADVWPRLSGAEQNLTKIGAVLSLGGNGILVERLTGQGLSINFQGASNSEANHNSLRGGWKNGCIMFLNTDAAGRISNNRAIGNMVSDHAFQGIAFMACDGCTLIGNTAYGCEEAGFKMFVNDVVGADPCTGIISVGNNAIACFQLGFDFTQQYPTNGSMSSPSSSTGDRASWCPLSAFNINGSGWNISGMVAELNPGPALYAVVSDSIITGVFRENCFANINGGVLNNVTVNGTNNTVSVRVYNETTRNAQYQMAVSSTRPDGIFGETYSTSLVNCDLRDLVTPAGTCLILGGGVTHLENVRTNGTYDTPMHSPIAVTLTYSASITPDLALGNKFNITPTNTTAFGINAPLSRAGNGNATSGGQRIAIRIFGTLTIGAITFNAAYKVSTSVAPANGFNRTWEFDHNGNGVWYQVGTPVDVPN